MTVTKRRHHESTMCINVFATVIPDLIGNLFAKLCDDPVFNDQICILDALDSVHLRTFKLPHISRQNSRQRPDIIYNSPHNLYNSVLK